LRDAARLQDMLGKAQGGLDDLASQAFNLQGAADYYSAINAWPAFLMIQNELARIEQQLRNRQLRGVDLANEVSIALGQASGYRDEVLKAAGALTGKLAQDQKRTYREDLAERFASFDLRKTLREMVQAVVPAQAAGGS